MNLKSFFALVKDPSLATDGKIYVCIEGNKNQPSSEKKTRLHLVKVDNDK